MGHPMARNLASAGFHIVAHDADSDALMRACDATGAEAPGELEAAAERCEAVITMLPDGDAVRAAVLGPGGRGDCLLAGFSRGSVLVDMSSSSPVGTRELGARLAERGVAMLDAPVSGGVRKAADATLSIMVGGDARSIARCRALFEAIGKQIFIAGPLGSGHAMKALNNYVSSAGLIAVVEALLIGRKFGLDPALMADILNASSGKNNTTEGKLKQFIISETFADGFPLRLMAKDVRTADDMAHSLGIATPMADLCAQLWAAAAQALDERANHTQVLRYMEGLGR